MLARAPARVVVRFDDAVRVAPGNAAVRNGGALRARRQAERARPQSRPAAPRRARRRRLQRALERGLGRRAHRPGSPRVLGRDRPAAARADAPRHERGRLRHRARALGLLRRTARRLGTGALRPPRLAADRAERHPHGLDRALPRCDVRLLARPRAREPRRRRDALRADGADRVGACGDWSGGGGDRRGGPVGGAVRDRARRPAVAGADAWRATRSTRAAPGSRFRWTSCT